jgi:hypothetical protein
VRSHDLIRLLDEPGPESGAPLCKYLFWIDPIGMNAVWGGSGKSRRAAGCAAPISRKRPISRPGHRFPGGRITQPGETEVPSAVGQR